MEQTNSKTRQDVGVIVLVAFLVRLLALPWAQTVHADAVSRIQIANDWLTAPHYITHGYWGPLHHYLNALFLALFPGKDLGPVVLNMICASLTAIPIYGIATNLFASRKGAILAALLYVFSPIAMWTSLQPLSEISYGLFLASSMYFLSRTGSLTPIRDVVFAGLLLTCAAATRYEAWVIIAVFTFVALLLRPWRQVLVFWSCAMLFPVTWMIGNQLEFGDALYSVNQNDVWNMVKEGINDSITPAERFKRVIFFPWSFSLNVSFIVAGMIAAGLIWALVRRKLTRTQLIWLIPFVVMVGVFQKKAWEGSLMLHHRFLITWLVLLLPFLPVALLGTRWLRLRWTFLVAGAILVIPFTRLWNKIPFMEIFAQDNVAAQALEDLSLAYYRELEVIPRLPDTDATDLLKVIDGGHQPGDGVLVDFIGWDRSYFIALHAEAHAKVLGGAKHEEYDPADLSKFFAEFPHGYIVLSRTGKLKDRIVCDSTHWFVDGIPTPLTVVFMKSIHGNFLYRYTAAANVPKPAEGLVSVFPGKNDALFFEDAIRKDEAWFNKIKRHAFLKHQSLEEAMKDNVDYMLFVEGSK